MIRKIIKINREKCNGCGLCAAACHEGAIQMVDGKAELLKDDYCDGLGDCLPACPTGAITFEEREAAAYDKAAVQARMKEKARTSYDSAPELGGTSGADGDSEPSGASEPRGDSEPGRAAEPASRLSQWPVQIKLVPVTAPYFDGASLLVAADCTAFAYGNFHETFIRNRITLIGCPKLDAVDYAEKLAEILRQNDIRDITVVRMEVPCCKGIEYAVNEALRQSGKRIPRQTVVISTDGKLLE